MSQLTPEEWTEFWNFGGVTTFTTGFDHGYDGSLKDFWTQNIDVTHSRIIDLCCGNGALVWLAHELLGEQQASAEITGIDLADIRPFKKLGKGKNRYPGVSFLGKTSIERLPQPDNSADLAISQYGLEYADFEKTIPELSRVLEPSARIALIMHSPRSSVLLDMRSFHDNFSHLFGEANLPDKLRLIDDIYNANSTADGVKNDARYKQVIGEINRFIYPITHSYMDTFTPLIESPASELTLRYINWLFAVFHNRGINNKARRKALDVQIERIETTLNRVRDMEAAAVSEQRFQQLIELLKGHNFDIKEQGDIYYGNKLNYGWKLVAERG